MSLSQFIVYACPQGELAEQIETFYQESLKLCGSNAAYNYMPHCTLTGFFQDQESQINLYIQAIETAYNTAQLTAIPLKINVTQMTFQATWYGLELQAQGIPLLLIHFSQLVNSATRLEALRLKTWLHLSLAYEFQPQHARQLQDLAQNQINPYAQADWELRFYQRHLDQSWTCHQSWQLTP
ncbi:conserved hypothetical protein [Planktothrix agardhii]|uniref:hypothetical protein n=1 Tax=Planktothrix agardhii TaxID=1160 RepID=UPI0003FA590D|nr:hypothetical protein [Planktothrix agardhii]CAD0226408.1 conserved hypothetical protein [Planktothrix agardhii]